MSILTQKIKYHKHGLTYLTKDEAIKARKLWEVENESNS